MYISFPSFDSSHSFFEFASDFQKIFTKLLQSAFLLIVFNSNLLKNTESDVVNNPKKYLDMIDFFNKKENICNKNDIYNIFEMEKKDDESNNEAELEEDDENGKYYYLNQSVSKLDNSIIKNKYLPPYFCSMLKCSPNHLFLKEKNSTSLEKGNIFVDFEPIFFSSTYRKTMCSSSFISPSSLNINNFSNSFSFESGCNIYISGRVLNDVCLFANASFKLTSNNIPSLSNSLAQAVELVFGKFAISIKNLLVKYGFILSDISSISIYLPLQSDNNDSNNNSIFDEIYSEFTAAVKREGIVCDPGISFSDFVMSSSSPDASAFLSSSICNDEIIISSIFNATCVFYVFKQLLTEEG
jgi:hypothetical protein